MIYIYIYKYMCFLLDSIVNWCKKGPPTYWCLFSYPTADSSQLVMFTNLAN